MITRGRVLTLVLVFVLAVALSACTRVLDDASPRAEIPVAPIAAGQANDLLSAEAQDNADGDLFVTVDPERCAGVAREVDPPFVFGRRPAAHAGGHWVADGGRGASIEEIVGVYRANYDARAAIDDVKRTIASCVGTSLAVVTLEGSKLRFDLPKPVDSGAPEIVLWSLTDPGWACDNAFVAAHNAAIEITACNTVNGYDVLALARGALQRIEALANSTA